MLESDDLAALERFSQGEPDIGVCSGGGRPAQPPLTAAASVGEHRLAARPSRGERAGRARAGRARWDTAVAGRARAGGGRGRGSGRVLTPTPPPGAQPRVRRHFLPPAGGSLGFAAATAPRAGPAGAAPLPWCRRTGPGWAGREGLAGGAAAPGLRLAPQRWSCWRWRSRSPSSGEGWWRGAEARRGGARLGVWAGVPQGGLQPSGSASCCPSPGYNCPGYNCSP